MPVQFQSTPTPSPTVTKVDGAVTVTTDLLVTGGLTQIEAVYRITSNLPAVTFQNGDTTDRRPVSVHTTQITLRHDLHLKCKQSKLEERAGGVDISLSIFSNGVFQTGPKSCPIGIASYTCPPTAVGGPQAAASEAMALDAVAPPAVERTTSHVRATIPTLVRGALLGGALLGGALLIGALLRGTFSRGGEK